MRLLLRSETGDFSLTNDLVGDDPIPPYAILSHVWGRDTEEVTFEDIRNGTGKNKPGYKKIRFCDERARQDGLQYSWVDTCCIDKSNDGEHQKAINSMFRWYCNATRCYAYLPDVSAQKSRCDENLSDIWDLDFRRSKWFTRGWTLQELLAPASVEFFSREGTWLGDKSSLWQQIHNITGISVSALQGESLSQISINERFAWIERRKTMREEDKAYSLLGIFGVYIPIRYGEGLANANRRLEQEIHKLEKCTRDLRITDPRDDKQRIEETKGGLLEGSYCWILENSDFQQWRYNQQSRLLWVKGDPGKGKTMLLCGIINELKKSTAKSDLLSYFFCQATNSSINNATAVLRGLIYLLIDQQPYLISHVRKKYDQAGKMLFEDDNAWFTLSEILTSILQDSNLDNTFFIVDALDECVEGLPRLLNFIVRISCTSRAKWIISSRNWPSIEQNLDTATQKLRLSLELNEDSVSAAITAYIQFKVDQLAERKKYSRNTQDIVQHYLLQNAHGTFLWVALVCQELSKTSGWKAQQKLTAFPPRLDALYSRMMEQIKNSEDAELCKRILAIVSAVYRPLTLCELESLVDMPDEVAGEYEALSEIIGLCGSFLTLRERTISFIHQSAKDFLIEKTYNEIFPFGIEHIHHTIFSRSLQVMLKTLGRDLFSLNAPGITFDQVKQPSPDPLSQARYSCVYWIDHLLNSNPRRNATDDLQDDESIYKFLCQSYLYWLEALSFCRSISKGVILMGKLEAFAQARSDVSGLLNLIKDAHRFIMSHNLVIENSPLQAYASALLFSPSCSLIKGLFKHEEPEWITIQPPIPAEWSACLQTLEGHSNSVSSVAFSPDLKWLASASYDDTIRIWDASSGACLQTLKGNSNLVTSVAFSPDSRQLASASGDYTVKIRDASSGACLQTLEGHSHWVNSVAFSPDSKRLASASSDHTVRIWDTSSGACLQTLEGHSGSVISVTFSPDSKRLMSASDDDTVRIWDTSCSACLQMLEGHSGPVISVAFSPDSKRLASASRDHTVRIWDASSSACLQTLEGHSHWVNSAAFSPDSKRLASASSDHTVRIWDTSSGACLQTLEGHSGSVISVTFSPDSKRLMSASDDDTVRIWDTSCSACHQMLEGHSGPVISVAFSPDSKRLASASRDHTVRIWDASSSACLQKLEGHSDWVNSVAFSPDSKRLASASGDHTLRIWDYSSGACLQTLKGHSRGVISVTFSPDSKRLTSASGDDTVRIWDASSGACLQTLKGHSHWVNSAAFSPDSKRLASASGDYTVRIWDTSSGACLQTLEGHSWWVISVAFSPDSKRLASASDDHTIRIWDTSSGACLQTLKVATALNNISFNTTGLFLHTEIGYIALDSLIPSTTSTGTNFQVPVYENVGLSSDRAWITFNSENILWLPSEYRPSCSAVSARTVAMGSGSGKVWMCSIISDNSRGNQ